jgi:hypothetical protein
MHYSDGEALVMLYGILPTRFECDVLNGRIEVAHPTPSETP